MLNTTKTTIKENVMYKSEGKDYEMVCEAIRWDKTIHAIKVMRRANVVNCTGTLLKPDEWGKLQRFNEKTLPDGSKLKIKNVPSVV
jgi:hypothetical protein